MKILVIVPAYNEEAIIADTVRNIREKVPEADILVINDGSKDHTAEILKNIHVNYLDLCTNLGIGGAVQSGFLYAAENNYDYAVQIDGDGQHDPGYIMTMIRKMKDDNADLMIGSRYITKDGFQSSSMRRFGITFLRGLLNATCGADIKDVTSGYRVVNKKGIKLFSMEYSDDYPEPDSIILAKKNKLRVREFPVVMKERTTGVSSIGVGKSVYYMLKVSMSIIMYGIMKKGSVIG